MAIEKISMFFMSALAERKVLKIVLCVVFGVAAAASIIALFTAKKIFVISILGAASLAVFLMLSGNPRLFCLWGLLLSAPLSLGKSFKVVPHMGGAAAYMIQISDIFLFGMLIFLLRDYAVGYKRFPKFPRVAYYWVGLVAIGLLTFVLGPYRHIAGHEVFQTLKHLLLFWVIVNEVVRLKQFLHVIGALFAGVFLQACIGIVQYVFKANLGLQVLGEATAKSIEFASKATYMDGGNIFRVGGLIGHPNLLGAYMALLLPIGIALLFSRIKPVYKQALIAVILLGVCVLLFTLSRASWIAFAFAFCCLLGLSFLHPTLQKRHLLARLSIIAGVAVFALVFSGPIIKRFTQSDPGAVNFRYEWVEVSWNMVKAKPLFGFGLNSFVFQMPPYTRYANREKMVEKFGEDWPVVHNIYMLIWSEQGTLGVLLFIAFNFHVVWLAMKNAKYFVNDVVFLINLGYVSGFMAIMIDGLGSFFIRNPACGRMYWIVVALIVAVHYWQKANRHMQSARQYDAAALVVPEVEKVSV